MYETASQAQWHRRGRRLTTVVAITGLALVATSCSSSSKSSTTASTAPGTTSAADAGLLPIDNTALKTTVDTMAKEMLVAGAVVILRTPKGNFTTTYGTTTLGSTVAPTTRDRVRVGSITKAWTATAILQQVQEGKLRTDDPVSKYRPGVPNGDNITIAELLNMRSGLFNYTETLELNQTLDNEPQKAWTQDELLALGFAHPPYFPPGQGYHYSNTNTILLGVIAEKLDAKPLAQVFQDRLFAPAGMKNTVFPDVTSSAIPAPYSRGYTWGSNVETKDSSVLSPEKQAAAKVGTLKPMDVTNVNPSWGWSAGAGISTADDLVSFGEAMAAGKLLNADMQAKRLASLEPVNPGDPGGPLYGWGIAKFGPLYGHTGELPGYNAFMGSDPEHKVTLVVWVNVAPSVDGKSPATTIARALIGKVYAPPATTSTASSPTTTR